MAKELPFTRESTPAFNFIDIAVEHWYMIEGDALVIYDRERASLKTSVVF